MSTAFTAPGNATWQALLSEIALALRERMGALLPYRNAPALYELEDDRDVQYVGYWTSLQSYTQGAAIKYVDHLHGPFATDPDTGEESVLLYSLATFREAAGLNASGFRRATEWDGITEPEWSYGSMEVGDIIGPWIFEDLQKAFKALKWTVKGSSSGANDSIDIEDVQEKAADGGGTTKEAALSLANANWAAASWGDPGTKFPWTTPIYGAKAYADLQDFIPHWYVYSGARSRGKIVIKNIFTEVPCSIEVYSLAIPAFAEPFSDIDAFGMVNKKYFHIEDFAENTISPRTTAMYGDITAAPFDITPFPPGEFTARSCLWNLSSTIALLKWDFTNA